MTKPEPPCKGCQDPIEEHDRWGCGRVNPPCDCPRNRKDARANVDPPHAKPRS